MGFSVKLVLLLVTAQGSLLNASAFTFSNTFKQDWKKVAEYNAVMREVCHECDNLCPRAPYGSNKEERTEIAEQWACYVGCRSTCLLQVGPDKYSYDTSVDMCNQACRDQFVIIPNTETMFSALCIEACNARVASPTVPPTPPKVVTELSQPDLADEQETGLFDPALGEPYPESGGLPHSNYKTLPHHDFQQISAKSYFDYLVKFIKDPTTDPLLAGAIGIPLVVLLFGIAAYYIVLSKKPQNDKEIGNACNMLEELEGLTVLHVQLETNIKKIPPPTEFVDDDFVPPPSPPPKYSEVVQTV